MYYYAGFANHFCHFILFNPSLPSLQDAKSNPVCYLPPQYDCTPTKRFKTEPLSVSMAAEEEGEGTSTKRYTGDVGCRL